MIHGHGPKYRPGLFLLALCLAPIAAAQGVITTIAGSDKLFPADGAPATSIKLSPVGCVVAPDGDFYFADETGSAVLKIHEGVLSVVAGNGLRGYSGDGGPAQMASLDAPVGLAFDSAGSLYIADRNNHRIRRVDSKGIITTVAGMGEQGFSGDGGLAVAAQLYEPTGVTFNRAGSMFIADSSNSRIRVVNSDGIIDTFAGNGALQASGDGGPAISASFIGPQWIVADTQGNVYVADTLGSQIRRIDLNGIIRTVAGTGEFGYSGDGGAAIDAKLSYPAGLSIDNAGTIYFSERAAHAVRRIRPGGVIDTVTGTGRPYYSGDGGPATKAEVAYPWGTAIDSAGNLFISDNSNGVIRKIDTSLVISTFAGRAEAVESSDPTDALLLTPKSVAADTRGNVYVADWGNHLIRRINTDGTVAIIAGTGTIGYSGDGGPATAATLASPFAIAVDRSGAVYVADRDNQRVRRILPSGIMETVAGNGELGFSGDGGAATQARLAYPSGVAVDADGNIYIADTANQSIRRVNRAGIITTFAGSHANGYSGDGGPATSALLSNPRGVAVDDAGNLYISETTDGRIRKVDSTGIMTTFADLSGDLTADGSRRAPIGMALDGENRLYIADFVGNRILRASDGLPVTVIAGTGAPGFSGDGLPATLARLTHPEGVAIDSANNLYIADSDNQRIRKVLASSPNATVTVSSLQFNTPADIRQISANGSVIGLRFTASAMDPWLRLSYNAGQLPVSLQASIDATGLGPGTYSTTMTITVPDAEPSTFPIAVNLTVPVMDAAKLGYDPSAVSMNAIERGSAVAQSVAVTNRGAGSLSFSATSDARASWLRVSTVRSTASASADGILQVTADPSGLAAGTYNTQITLSSESARDPVTVPVSLTVVPVSRPRLVLSQTGLSFRTVTGSVDLPQCVALLNQGSGNLGRFTVATTTTWLKAETKPCPWQAVSGTVGIPEIVISVDATHLDPGNNYAGQVVVTAPDADNGTQVLPVKLRVLEQGQNLGMVVRPSGLVFLGTANNPPGSLDVYASNFSGSSYTYLTGLVQDDPRGWLVNSPTQGTVQTLSADKKPANIKVAVKPEGLGPGQYWGTLTLQSKGDPDSRTVAVLLATPSTGDGKVAPSQSRSAEAPCLAGNASVLFTQVSSGFVVSAGDPLAIEVYVGDACGSPMRTGSVLAKFSNGDDSIQLTPLGDGRWAGTWIPRILPEDGQVILTVQASVPGRVVSGRRSVDGRIVR